MLPGKKQSEEATSALASRAHTIKSFFCISSGENKEYHKECGQTKSQTKISVPGMCTAFAFLFSYVYVFLLWVRYGFKVSNFGIVKKT